ncbi:MAG: alpha/beta hydrolase-fold protein [Myxococcaceae bacterium]
MRLLVLSVFLPVLLSCQTLPPEPTTASVPLRFAVRYPAALAPGPLDGRLLVLIAVADTPEPRLQLDIENSSDATPQVFGVDVNDWKPGSEAVLDADTLGYPMAALGTLPPGEYWVQAVLHRYETFRRADGSVVKLPPDRGEGQQWNKAPGNLVSTPRRVYVNPHTGWTVALQLDRALPELPTPADTQYLKHVHFRSEKLSRFWGRDTFLSALVLLPEGWDSHTEAHYPLVIYESHFSPTLDGYRGEPPEAQLPPVDLAGLARHCPNGHEDCVPYGYTRMVQEYGWRFHQQWTGPGFPRVLLVQLQHANPFYDDSYAVNSANVGPYGDAITEELVPYLEKTYRGLGPWARGLYGGSTGGWISLADQVLYPDAYNGAIANCPDPVDFSAFMTVDLSTDKNAYFSEGTFRRTPRSSTRNADGYTKSTMEQDNLVELVAGASTRSGGQFDAWEAVYSPVGPDGYPKRIWDKRTGTVDAEVARYWHEHYDLTHILKRDWATLGPKLQGKLWVNVGNLDTYFLDGAVRRLDAFLRSTSNPHSDAVVRYGERDGHCWSGDAEHMNFESRLTYHSRFIPLLVAHFLKTAPAGADTTSWRY